MGNPHNDGPWQKIYVAYLRSPSWGFCQDPYQWWLLGQHPHSKRSKTRLSSSLDAFSLTTQPLLDYLDHKRTHNRMTHMQTTNNLFVCKWLFSNDIGLLILATKTSFIEVETCIFLYKLAAGAKLNLTELMVLPIGLQTIPQWLVDKGPLIIPWNYLQLPWSPARCRSFLNPNHQLLLRQIL